MLLTLQAVIEVAAVILSMSAIISGSCLSINYGIRITVIMSVFKRCQQGLLCSLVIANLLLL